MSIKEQLVNSIVCHNSEKVQSILEKHPEMKDAKCDSFNSPMLHLAIEKSNEEIVTLLLAAGSNPNNQDSKGNTALHKAATLGSLEKCKVLIEWNANPKIPMNGGYLPFNAALNSKNQELVDYLRMKTHG
ncbi:ankyrin repeat domain-containing protein [Aliikangiella coralliicola]|uniref:Ankyrin repeat domain-containing protein n=1 Tax=Aliikangiella coralliicola TaxID=2592383 RepID=A0A545UFP3_9GAMM|nr:ankyrin repeat domain-containing protein [Aliikangiella coralliicola]TQV88294.1 ankyrin repeat domain-containing protein [Aliikangiella coralliicola]